MKTEAPPAALVAAFKAKESSAQLAPLLVEDGWDAETMRVLGAWATADVSWSRPKKPCPDSGQPTAAAWAWLRSGMAFDVNAIAEAAGVTRAVARDKLDMLIAGRVIYPDGSTHKLVDAAIRSHIASHLKGKKKKDGEKGGGGKPPGGGVSVN